MPTTADLIETARQERINAEEYLTRAEAEKNPDRATEWRACAALCFSQAEHAELLMAVEKESRYGHS